MNEFHPIFNKINEAVTKATSILVISHQNPDGDAIGSLIGISHYLQYRQKTHVLFCLTAVPEYLRFISGSEKIQNDETILKKNEYDLVILLDSGDLQYAGVAEHFRTLKGLPVVINIDHHPTNQYYGHVNLVHAGASSTSEIIYHFLDFHRIPFNKEVATALLTGIMTDTGSFTNMATTPSSMEASSRLMAYGARVKDINANTMRNKSLNQLQLWGRALSRLKLNKKTGIVTTVLIQKDFKELQMDEDSSEGISNFLNSVGEAKAIIVLREKSDGTIKASLRTTQPGVDVSKIAKYFGGGGHKKAAGFNIKGKLTETDEGWRVV
ncbi:MAG: DHH family phosphoesterase [Patescibacteria group bacterium]|jgi:phosphoesterase RecJ-like protein